MDDRNTSDTRIIELFFDRKEEAITEVSKKYFRLYRGILRELLNDEADVEECANDILITLWNSIPPDEPRCLPSYICSIARRIGINRYKHNTRKKLGSGYTVQLSELEECLSASAPEESDEEWWNGERIRSVLNDFLRELDTETRVLFVRRYYYMETVSALANRFDMSENFISVRLHRARKRLKKLLEKEGIRA